MRTAIRPQGVSLADLSVRIDRARREHVELKEEFVHLAKIAGYVRGESRRVHRDLEAWRVGYLEQKHRNFEEAARLLRLRATRN